ncbi:MAG: MFS transporter [Brevirhabdus sp.]
MTTVLRNSWALFLGMMLLMVGNGLQGTLLGVRGGIEGFSTFQMSVIMAGYFAGFLGGSQLAPHMIRRVGHVRVFAALASFVSAILISFPLLTDPISWTLMRVAIGFCFSGVYVTAESWLNNAATNETRGQTLSIYVVVQMAGIVAAQGIVSMGDPAGYVMFIIPSILVSISFAPILLSISPAPPFEAADRMSFRDLFKVSPLGCVSIFFLGSIFSALFGMAAVFGTQINLTLGQISLFISAIYLGGLVLQMPIGWLSDRMDRRALILFVSALGALAAVAAISLSGNFYALLVLTFVVGGMANPLYALIIAYTNDFLEHEQMAGASGSLIFINGIGAIAGPIVTGWLMGMVGPNGFFAFIALMLTAISGYALYRATQRPAPTVEETAVYAPILPSSTPVAMEAAQEYAIEVAIEEESEATEGNETVS